MRWMAAIFMSLAMAQAAWAVPPDFTANYATKKYGIGAGLTRISLRQVGDTWQYHSFTRPKGIASLFIGDKTLERRSILKLEDETLVPLEYHYIQKGGDKNRDEHYRYDWDAMTLSGNARGEAVNHKLEPGATDEFSLELRLIEDVIEGGKEVRYKVVDRDEWDYYEYRRLPKETVDSQLGRVETIPLQRVKDNKKKTTYTVWFAPRFNYLPVKFEKTEKGDVVLELELEAIEWHDAS